jgi:hypothetical protein
MHELAGGTADPTDPDWRSVFMRRISSFDFFVVTLMQELEDQPVVKTTLYEEYNLFYEGDGIIITDIRAEH